MRTQVTILVFLVNILWTVSTDCDEGTDGIPCCPSYVMGDMVGGGETEITFSPKTEAGCQNSCKVQHPTSIGVTQLHDGTIACWCEFGSPVLGGNNNAYKTCMFCTAIDGGWSEWSPFSPCSATCGSATKSRMRTCSEPSPSNGGNTCPENKWETVHCEFISCPSNVTDSDITTMVNKLNITNAFASSNLDENESENCMKNIKHSLRKYQETEALIEKFRKKKPFIRNTKVTDRLGKDSRLFSTLKETISRVSSGWSSPSKGEHLINHFSQDFQKWAEKGGGLSIIDKETRTTNPVSVECDTANDEYRRIDGKCNNIVNKTQGSACTALKRFLNYSYADGVKEPRGVGSLPSARIVSTNIHHASNPTPATSKGYTHMVMQFGQFLDHDITMTPELMGGEECCNAAIITDPNICFNIDITGDKFYSGKTKCHSFTRSDSIVTNTSQNIREQINGITAFLDASNVYGSDDELAQTLRTLADGKLKTHEDGPMLPTRKQCGLEIKPPEHLEDDLVAGDSRATEQPTLASIHSLFLNEHNRIAEELKSKLSTYLSYKSASEQDELLYQESRKIVGAEMQNIVYNEFLPIVLGQTEFKKHDLELGTVTQYNSAVDPSIRNEFATVAFRFGHSLISGIFFGNGGHQLRKHYFDEDPIFVSGKKPTNNNGRAWYSNLEEETKQKCPADDIFCTQDVTNFLFSDTRGASSDFGEDLPARNIQRGRDHGIPSYNDFRSFCDLSPLTDFNSKPAEISDDNWSKIQNVYKNVADIDAFTAGLAENSPSDGLVGPIFACIIGKQFANLKYGDRYFFNNEPGKNDNARGLMINSRETVRQRTLRDIMCDNTDICQLQKFVMKEKDIVTNPQQVCSSRNILDFDGIASDIISNGKSCKDDNGQIHNDGDVTIISGTKVVCCQGKWIIPYVVTGGNNLVVTGGNNGDARLDTSETIGPAGVCSQGIPPLPVALDHVRSVFVDGNLMTCGGWNGTDTQDACYFLKDHKSQWIKGPSMKIPRRHYSLTKVGQEVFAIGGASGGLGENRVRLDSMEKYSGGQWTLLPQTVSHSYRYLHCTVYLKSLHSLVVIGGASSSETNKVHSFDISSGQWTDLDSLPFPLSYHGCIVFNETIYVIGGWRTYFRNQKLVYKYKGGQWEMDGELEEARSMHSIGLLDGKVTVAGGYGDNGTLTSVETMDHDGNWKKTTFCLSGGRDSMAMAEVPSESFPSPCP